MKLKGKMAKVLLFISVLGILAIASGIWYSNIDNGKDSGWGGISLVRPAFAQDATTSFLEKEAGIACYTKLNQKIDLATAKKAFRTIEKNTDTYVLGSVPITGYATSDDVHCFIHKDGWIVAYYLRDEPTSKIMYWYNWDGKNISTKILEGLVFAGSIVGVTPTDVKYYHFKYPDANRLMIIADKDSFKLTIPGSLVIHERSFSTIYTRVGYYDKTDEITIDGQNLGDGIGLITFSQLKPDVVHAIKFESDPGGAIVIVYQGL